MYFKEKRSIGSGKEQREKAWFHGRKKDITSEAWHAREATKAIKDEEIDWLLRG